MVPFSGLFQQFDIVSELFFGRESYSIYSLKTIISVLSKPISRGVLHDFECLNSVGRRDVRSSTQINKVTISVGSDLVALWYFVRN